MSGQESWTIDVDLTPLDDVIAQVANPQIGLITEAIREAAEYVRQTWQRAVSGEVLPGMSRPVNNDQYYEALETGAALRMITPLHGAVVCLYDGADRIEEGFPTYDMKPGLLAGPSSRMGKHGRYNIVPFRHMTPGSGQGAAAGKRPHGAAMPPDVYKIVKKTGTFQDPGNARRGEQFGQRSKLPVTINLEAKARNLPNVMQNPYTWKYGMYHGMKQIKKTYEARVQSTYWTFRTVSERSEPDSWIHPGQSANPLIAAVVGATRAQVADIIMAGARAAFGVE